MACDAGRCLQRVHRDMRLQNCATWRRRRDSNLRTGSDGPSERRQGRLVAFHRVPELSLPPQLMCRNLPCSPPLSMQI